MKKSKRRGQGMVELAILLPFLLLVIVGGIIDFGFAFFNMITLQQLANDGAQYAAESNGRAGRSTSEVQAYVLGRAPSWWAGSGLTGIVTTGTTTNNAPTRMVTLTYQSKTYTPFYQTILKGIAGSAAIPLKAAATYQVPQAL